MEDLSRAEYPAMLANLQPGQAAQALNDRVRRISKLNAEISEWLQERRRVEELYVSGLRKLAQHRVPNMQSELGTFQLPWDKIVRSVEALANSHHTFASKIEKDVEAPLRSFDATKEMQNMHTIQTNLQNSAKELEDAQSKSDKLAKKGPKASAQKMSIATSRLESASQNWESEAPFIFETLQALDETRMNLLRDILTQYGTYEGEQAQHHQSESEAVLNNLLDYSTADEVQYFVSKTIAGRPKLEKRPTSMRQSSSVATTSSESAPPPPVPAVPSNVNVPTPPPEEERPETSMSKEAKEIPPPAPENKLRSRIGTMLGRRRQSIHGGFGQLSPAKSPFTRASKSSQGLSPKPSSTNLDDSPNRLESLAEADATEEPPRTSEASKKQSHEGTNGVAGSSSQAGEPNASILDTSDVFPDTPTMATHKEPQKDSEGFSVPAASHDPITEAQMEAAGGSDEGADQMFKLHIQQNPVAEEDPEKEKAALSNVASSLAMGMPSRRTGTIRGRRDVRNTIYMPSTAPNVLASNNPFPSITAPSPSTAPRSPIMPGNLVSEPSNSIAGTSDTQSVRSGNSFGSIAHMKHPHMHEPGLNSSIMETVSASFEGDVLKSVKVNGEIAFAFNITPDTPPPAQLPIRINNFPTLEAIGPNRIFVNNATTGNPDQFMMDVSHLHQTTIAFSYKVHVEEKPPAQHLPILLQPAWKPQGDKLGLLLQYKPNPDFKFATNDDGSPIQVRNLVLFATYEGKASGVQTKPLGTHVKDKHLVYWRIGDVTLGTGADWSKIVCRIIGEQNAEPMPGSVEARWEYYPPTATPETSEDVISVSRLEEGKGKGKDVIPEEDPFADGEADPPASDDGSGSKWVDVPVIRKTISGKYEAR